MNQPVPMPSREGEATMMRRRSNALLAVRAHQVLIDQVLLSLEEATSAGESRLQKAGKAAYRMAMEEQAEATHAGAAQRLFDAVTGYLFRAYLQNPGRMTAVRLHDFRGRVYEGIEQGTFEARRMMAALGQRGIASEHALVRTADMLRSRLERWFRRQAESTIEEPAFELDSISEAN